MKNEIVIRNLYKNFGKNQALKNINLNIETGMFGLLGRNGAGKTTLMRILATLLNKTSGDIKVCDFDIKNSKEIRNIIGYLPQEFSMYPNMTVYEVMDYLGILSNVLKSIRKERILDLLNKVNLENSLKVKVKALSGGMKKRLGIAQAILNDPKVLIVDEPTAGLDPQERVRFRDLLCSLAKDRIVILSTHIVEDVEKTCNRIAILDKGEIMFYGMLKEFIGKELSLEDAYMKQMGGVK